MAGSITSANSIYTLAIPGLFSEIVQLKGYAADDIFTTDLVPAAEVVMGMDGILSAGMVPAPVVQHITLQADSQSLYVFESWYHAQRQSDYMDLYFANATVTLPSLSMIYYMFGGVLTNFPPVSDAARTLRPRRYTITWESLKPSPTSNKTTPLSTGLIVPAQADLIVPGGATGTALTA